MRGTLKATLILKNKQNPFTLEFHRVYVSPCGGKPSPVLDSGTVTYKPTVSFFVYHVYSATGNNIPATIDNESKNQEEVYKKVKEKIIANYVDYELIQDEIDK